MKIWKEDYLNNLREYSLRDRKENRSLLPHKPIVGEKVLLKEKIPRCNWQLFSIKELVRSSDGKVHSVILESELGKEFLRPITKVCPLEADLEEVFLQK